MKNGFEKQFGWKVHSDTLVAEPGMWRIVGRLLCLFGLHKKKYLPAPDGYMDGIFAPVTCARGCGWKHDGFPYPAMPPMPEVNVAKLGKQKKNCHCFPLVEFRDYYDKPCSLQASSLAICQRPGTSAVWLGVDDAQPRVLASQAATVGIETTETTGWVPFQIPAEVSLSTRMHLDREQVKALIGHLQFWLDSEDGQFGI